MRHLAISSGLVCLLFGASAHAECPPINDTDRDKLADYVRKKYNLQANSQIEVSEISRISGTCYRKLQFKSQDTPRPFRIELVASPDLRFLTRELLDSRLDPVEEEKRKLEVLNAGLTAGKFPEMGPKDAPVTMVIFSDFECPFCSRMAKSLIGDILPGQPEKVRLIFRNFPLPGHPWARAAAESAACAQAQGDKYFWSFHDFLFDHQRQITVENLHQKLTDLGATIPGFDAKGFSACVGGRTASAAIDRDVEFGREVGVGATPTVFVNGRRVAGFVPEQLRTLIQELGATGTK